MMMMMTLEWSNALHSIVWEETLPCVLFTCGCGCVHCVCVDVDIFGYKGLFMLRIFYHYGGFL